LIFIDYREQPQRLSRLRTVSAQVIHFSFQFLYFLFSLVFSADYARFSIRSNIDYVTAGHSAASWRHATPPYAQLFIVVSCIPLLQSRFSLRHFRPLDAALVDTPSAFFASFHVTSARFRRRDYAHIFWLIFFIV